ncbi:MAG: hypothetical protein ACK4IX_16370, partial [Candidatus Sericytochromatia bacterium]
DALSKTTKDLKDNQSNINTDIKNFFSSKVTSYHEKLDLQNNFIGFIVDIKILNGQIKKGDKIDIINNENIRETFIVSKIYKDKEDNTYNSFNLNDYCSLELQTLKQSSKLRDKYYENLYITNIGVTIEKNLKFDSETKNQEITINNEPSTNQVNFIDRELISFIKDNSIFNIDNIHGSFIYYKSGIAGMYDGKPHLKMFFNLKNNSKISFIIKNFELKKGIVDNKMLEVVFSSNETNSKTSQNNTEKIKLENKESDFKFEIIKIKMLDENELYISAKFSGLLYSSVKSNISKIESGLMTNIKLKVLSEIY